jgi:hypothetical protein
MTTRLTFRTADGKTALLGVICLMLVGLLLGSATLLVPRSAAAASCTKGVNCYCDRVQSGDLRDTALLFCEDFEAPTLRNNQGVGNGAPYYGPWHDDSGQPGNRGVNSYWNRKYGNGVSSHLFASGQPSSPASGSPCGYALCVGTKVWDTLNRWSANAYGPLVAILSQASEFSAEVSSLRPPTNAAGGASGVFDGNASLAFRVPPGETHGIAGEARFSTTRNIGYTAALAYPINSMTSGIWGTSSASASWKHNEWTTVYNPNSGFDGLFAFYNQAGRTTMPFAGFIGSFRDQNYTNCSSIVATVGSASCIGSNLGINWVAAYNQPVDWPFGTWGCVRGYLENAGLSNMRMRIWFQGPTMTSERLILDFTANGTQLDNKSGYNGMKWNAYANTNQGGGYVPTTQTTYRYEDNTHVRAGMPVSCAQIGFGGASSGASSGVDVTPPAAPTSLGVR